MHLFAYSRTFFNKGMEQLTLTQMWIDDNHDSESEDESMNSNHSTPPVLPIVTHDSVLDDKSQSTISSWDTLQPHSHNDNVNSNDETEMYRDEPEEVNNDEPINYSDDDISFQSTQVNVAHDLLTQPSKHDYASGVQTSKENTTINTTIDTTILTTGDYLNNDMTKDTLDQDGINFGEESTVESDSDKYHKFLQSELGLSYEDDAHKEDVEYLVWVLEKYDEYICKK